MKNPVSSLLIVISLITGCSNTPVSTSEYLLRPGQELARDTGTVSIVLTEVGVPPYLDQPGIVLETAPNEVNAARHHRWAEPLIYSLQRYLQVAISRASNTHVGGKLALSADVEKQIDVLIHQMHTRASGDVLLVAEWRIIDPRNKVLLSHRNFSAAETLSADGYPAVVRAHENLLNRLAQDIAAELDTED